jgi:hypothetical protein
VLQRLDRLTGDEARTTAAQSLEVIYGLTQNMRAVIDSEDLILDLSLSGSSMSVPLDTEASRDGIREALGMFGR